MVDPHQYNSNERMQEKIKAQSEEIAALRGLAEEARGFIELRAKFLRNRDERIFKDDIFAMEGLVARIDKALREGGEA